MQSVSSPILFISTRRLFQNRNTLQSLAPIGPFLERPDESAQFTSVANAGFPSGLAFILAVLLFSILCNLGIAAFRRCSRRWRLMSEPSLNGSLERAKTGITKMDLKPLPARVYSTSTPLGGLDCPICLAEFVEGEKVRVLPDCCHSFHGDCIDAWLISKPSCPSCRKSLFHLGLKKPAGVVFPAAEADESAEMDVSDGNKFVGINAVVQTLHSSADDASMAVSSS